MRHSTAIGLQDELPTWLLGLRSKELVEFFLIETEPATTVARFHQKPRGRRGDGNARWLALAIPSWSTKLSQMAVAVAVVVEVVVVVVVGANGVGGRSVFFHERSQRTRPAKQHAKQ